MVACQWRGVGDVLAPTRGVSVLFVPVCLRRVWVGMSMLCHVVFARYLIDGVAVEFKRYLGACSGGLLLVGLLWVFYGGFSMF